MLRSSLLRAKINPIIVVNPYELIFTRIVGASAMHDPPDTISQEIARNTITLRVSSRR